MKKLKQSRTARAGDPPTVTTVGFDTGTAVSAEPPDLGVAIQEVNQTEYDAVLAFFDALELEFPGNLSPAEIQAAVAVEAPARIAAEFGATWGARVTNSEPVGNDWSTSGSAWVHPTKSNGVIYLHSGTEYKMPKIKVVRSS